MHSNSFAFGLSLTCWIAFQSASCTSPNPETVPPRPAATTSVARTEEPTSKPAPSSTGERPTPADEAEARSATREDPTASNDESMESEAESAESELEDASHAEEMPPAEQPAQAPAAQAPATTQPPPRPAAQPVGQAATQSAGPARELGSVPVGISPAPTEDSRTSIFGDPLYVNGKRVTDNQIKLYLIYGPARMMFEVARTGVVIEDELQRRATENAEAEIKRRESDKPFGSPETRKAALDAEQKVQLQQLHEKYAVTDAELKKETDRMDSDFLKNYPALDITVETNRAFRNHDWFTNQLRETIRFEKVFLPANPDEWPAVTTEAVRQDSGDVLLEDAQESYKSRKANAEKFGTELGADDPLYMQMMRDIVRTALFKLVDFKSPGNGLPDTLALWADTNGDGKPDRVITTEELWDQVKSTISQAEIDEAKQWFVTSIATHDRLEKDGFLLSPTECSQAIAAKSAGFDEGTYSLESLAMSTYNFPSLETYNEYFCMLEGFTKLSEPKLKPGPGGELSPALRDYFERANRCMGLGQVDVEVMLIGAFDIGKYAWKKDGWEWAKKESASLYKQIEDNLREYNEQRAKILEAKAKGQEFKAEKEVLEPYRFWTQMMDDHCEYWDPPAPEEKGHISMVGMKMKGRFGPHYRNDLISFIGETYYTEWLTGQSITDKVFFEQAEGTVAGPFKGPQGYYITRVLRRTPPTRGLNLADPKHVDLLRTDWLRFNFNQYAKEAAEKADVKGFPRS